MDAAVRQGGRNSWYRSELVVSLEHRREVLSVLDTWTVGFHAPTPENGRLYESQDLGLALIPLVDDADAAATAVRHLKNEAAADAAVAQLVRRAAGSTDAAEDVDRAVDRYVDSLRSGVDRVLWALRTHFAATYEGWRPTLGKNRMVATVEGGGNISHSEDPPSLRTSTWRPEPEPRPTEPGRGVRVGVLDTAMSLHPWLAGGLVGPAADCLGAQPDGGFPALSGHATFVAGLVMRRAPGCAVTFRRVLSDDDGSATSWDVARKVVELGRTGLDVLNLSLGSFTEDGLPPLVLATAIDRLDPEIVVVASAGNHGDVHESDSEGERGRIVPGDRRKPSWPAALDDVVAVGAADGDGTLTPFTPADAPWIDVLSNGVQVASTYLEGEVHVGYSADRPDVRSFTGAAEWSGTSFAAALVSGEIASRTVPGRQSARQAWREIRDELAQKQPDARPPFLQLI